MLLNLLSILTHTLPSKRPEGCRRRGYGVFAVTDSVLVPGVYASL